jgi:uncharacterized membrane protein YqgA involved in biofilm formation
MNGAFLNALGILLGALLGLIRREAMPARAQFFFRTMLGVVTIFSGVRLVAENLGTGFSTGLKKMLITFLAVVLGYWVGKLLRLQRMSNRLGRYAGRLVAEAQANPPGRPGPALAACVILFGAAPLGWLGAVEEGFTGHFYLFAVKALMDALAMAGFVKMFGWPPALAAFPVYVLFGGVTLACQKMAAPFCAAHHLLETVNAATGLVACAVSLVIFEIRRVELANFLPAVAVAPLLAWLWR